MLTVHKNTKYQRESKKIRSELIQEAKDIAKIENISGYVIVAWDRNNATRCSTGKVSDSQVPILLYPEYAKQILKRRINLDDTNTIIDDRLY